MANTPNLYTGINLTEYIELLKYKVLDFEAAINNPKLESTKNINITILNDTINKIAKLDELRSFILNQK